MIDDTVGEYVCLNCDSKGFSYDIRNCVHYTFCSFFNVSMNTNLYYMLEIIVN